MKKIFVVFTAFFVGNAFAADLRFGLNDVSLLLPLPQDSSEAEMLLSPRDGAPFPLIPEAHIKKLPQLILDDAEPEEREEQLRVIAIRFDPCFADKDGPFNCRKQIRLVFQPISEADNRPTTVDAALHAFYEFSDEAWNAVFQDWKNTLVGNPVDPLQIHPLIKKQTLYGSHWRKIRSLILKHCSSKNLTRVTISTVNTFGFQWAFQGLDIDSSGNSQFISIPRVQRERQIFFSNISNLQEYMGTMSPAPLEEAPLIQFLRGSQNAKAKLTENDLLKMVGRSVSFENPRLTHTGNLDCVSCHIAQSLQFWGQHNLKDWQNDLELNSRRFTSPWNLKNTSVRPFATNRVRAFGYFLDEPLFSQRVINETSLAADLMAKGL